MANTTISLTAVEVTAARMHAIELFNGLTGEEVLKLLAVSEELPFNPEDAVFQAGDTSRALYLILDGTVEIDLFVPKLGERVLAKLEVGSLFGEMSFFHPAPHSATAKCLTEARIMRLPRAHFDTLAAQNPHIVLQVTANAAEILAARLHHTDEWIVESLSSRREHEIRENWRKLRESLMTSFRPPKPFIGLGTTIN
ncbi:MAG: cyclic nucleotide-binding domain-containing protein [Planctomycetales bacterium]|nr:cyclic nucleotide-binding domain-containing protein [Planctomycetales bacterium]